MAVKWPKWVDINESVACKITSRNKVVVVESVLQDMVKSPKKVYLAVTHDARIRHLGFMSHMRPKLSLNLHLKCNEPYVIYTIGEGNVCLVLAIEEDFGISVEALDPAVQLQILPTLPLLLPAAVNPAAEAPDAVAADAAVATDPEVPADGAAAVHAPAAANQGVPAEKPRKTGK